MQPAKRLVYTPDPNKFDLRTHVWDAQGALVSKNLYTNHCIAGRNYFERPIQSGNLWFENNQPAGRVEYVAGPDGKMEKKIDENAAHVVFVPKLEGDDALFYALEQEKNRTAALELELAAIKADREKSSVSAAEASKVAAVESKMEMPSLKKEKA